MCGIAGLLGDVGPQQSLRALVERMTGTLAHRGPDGDGHWVDASGRVALGHRRLAIIDLSETGKQPMASASGRFEITFNGEIYNFERLRAELLKLGHRFRGRADTEVLPDSTSQQVPVAVGDTVIIEGHLTLTHDAPVRLVAQQEREE